MSFQTPGRVVPGVICCWFFDVAVPVYLLHLEMRGILCFISAQGEQPRSCDSGSFCPVLWASPLDAMGGCAHGGRQNKVMRHLKSPLSELPSVRVFAKTLLSVKISGFKRVKINTFQNTSQHLWQGAARKFCL